MGSDESRQQFPAAADAKLSVQRFDIDVHGVWAETQLPRDLFFTLAGQQQFQRLPHTRRKLWSDACLSGFCEGAALRTREALPEKTAKIRDHCTLLLNVLVLIAARGRGGAEHRADIAEPMLIRSPFHGKNSLHITCLG